MKKFDMKKLLESISYEPQLNLVVQMLQDVKDKNIVCNKYHYRINNQHYIIIENDYAKVTIGENYNFIFLKQNIFGRRTGFFQRWGKTIKDNPDFSPIGPEILDLEISVNGCPPVGKYNCAFCYKNNTGRPATNMPFDVFKSIIDKFPKTLTQVAFGITGVQTNPDFITMMEYCRRIGVLPNFTLSGADLTDELADKFSKVAGAIAVSAYDSDKNLCYDTVKKFTDRGMDQINIHLMVSQETLPFVYRVLDDRTTDPRLAKMHAIIFLGVKPKGRAKDKYHPLTSDQYKELVKFSFSKGYYFGFDSCSAPKFEASLHNIEIPKDITSNMIETSESCESSLFSSYINVYGEYWHCSFSEEEPFVQFIDVTQIENFLAELWYSPEVVSFRNKSMASMKDGCRKCTIFPSINE